MTDIIDKRIRFTVITAYIGGDFLTSFSKTAKKPLHLWHWEIQFNRFSVTMHIIFLKIFVKIFVKYLSCAVLNERHKAFSALCR